MNRLTYWGLGIGIVLVAAYVLLGLYRKKASALDLADATLILFSTVGATGAVRLWGFVAFDQLEKVVATAPTGMWSLTGEDGVFIVIGGMGLFWVSLLGICQGFINLAKAP